jgi:hypothetical protein
MPLLRRCGTARLGDEDERGDDAVRPAATTILDDRARSVNLTAKS